MGYFYRVGMMLLLFQLKILEPSFSFNKIVFIKELMELRTLNFKDKAKVLNFLFFLVEIDIRMNAISCFIKEMNNLAKIYGMNSTFF